MKLLVKFFCLLTLFLMPKAHAAIGELQDVGIAKYAVLEVTTDYAPLRLSPGVDAKRFSHLRKGVVLYADKKNDEFYRVVLDDSGKFYWIERKYVESQAIINNKIIPKVERVVFAENKKTYNAKLTMPEIQSSYEARETPEGINFTFFDAEYSPTLTKVEDRRGCFNLTNEKGNTFKLSYKSLSPIVGYGLTREEDGLSLFVNKLPKISKRRPLNNINIAIDPGHGGMESGAVGKMANGSKVLEKDVNLQISKRLRHELKRAGANVFMTRKKDKDLDLYTRIDLAKTEESLFLVSIHQNSLPEGVDVNKKHGVGTYYYNPMSKQMAESIQGQLLNATGFRDDGVNYASFALTRPTEMVSVLVECGYLIHPYELQMLTNKKFQKKIAKGIRRGLEGYATNLRNTKTLKSKL